eukprot:CAMPEP_0197072092 /NCGR_PEP_ID=MMETSP1384-20130603/209924_1 /TAXON_ID=29189 /ORGANISM="Ammonia sp." /LENGTH=287 /DNA_ID=CAMNT_0042510907 /DNA_START=607 /DNA_END=1467 /DNA_ORIENTATION=-
MIKSAFLSSCKHALKQNHASAISMRSRHITASAKQVLEGDVASYYGKNANYAGLFGTNIHFGYFPHIADPSQKVVNFAESGYALNKHMVDVAGINAQSNVIDFGCGVGGPIFDVSQQTNCKATGIDLTPEFVEQANQNFGSQSDRVNYVVGSITDLPKEVKEQRFSHLFSIQAVCHIAAYFPDVLREAHSVLDTNGVLVMNDFVVSENGPSEKAQEFFYKRLHFDKLLSFADLAEGLTNNGFDIVKYENCSKHAEYGYQILAPQAEEKGSMEKDGQPLAKHYQETSA